jgi:hypothetical protein
MRRLVAAFAACCLLASNANAALRIKFDPGGRLIDYIEKYNMLREAEAKIMIDGLCISACTLITGIIEDANVCVTNNARLAFHSASYGDTGAHASEGTRLAWSIYPEKVRALLRAKGWDGDDPKVNAHPDLIYVEGEELRTIYRDCSAPVVTLDDVERALKEVFPNK